MRWRSRLVVERPPPPNSQPMRKLRKRTARSGGVHQGILSWCGAPGSAAYLFRPDPVGRLNPTFPPFFASLTRRSDRRPPPTARCSAGSSLAPHTPSAWPHTVGIRYSGLPSFLEARLPITSLSEVGGNVFNCYCYSRPSALGIAKLHAI